MLPPTPVVVAAPPAPTPSNTDASAPPLDFDAANIGEILREASTAALQDAPFGIIRLDDAGEVQFYNRYESELSGVDPAEARGQNFFTQLAPCSNNRIFLGRFREGVEQDDLDERFTYTFTYKMRPTLVEVRLYRDRTGTNWVLIREQ